MPTWQPLPQVLPEIATNLYKGKAIRQQLAETEKESVRADERLDLERRRVEALEAGIDAEAEAKLGIDMANKAIGMSDEYTSMFESDGPESASENYKAQLLEIRKGVEDDSDAAKSMDRMLADDVIDANEIVRATSEALAVKNQYLNKQGGGKPSNLTNMYDPATGQRLSVRPESDYATELAGRGWVMGDPPTGGGTDINKLTLAEKFTSESIRAFADSGYQDASLLVPRETKSEKAPTGPQSKAASFAVRLEETNAVFDELAAGGADFTGLKSRFVGGVPQGLRTEDRQLYEQAKLDFINAKLRQESGAAISDGEYTRAEAQYFPVPGDTDAAVAQKKKNRELVEAALRAEAGPAYKVLKDEMAAGNEYLKQIDPTPGDVDEEGDLADGPNGEVMIFHNGAWALFESVSTEISPIENLPELP